MRKLILLVLFALLFNVGWSFKTGEDQKRLDSIVNVHNLDGFAISADQFLDAFYPNISNALKKVDSVFQEQFIHPAQEKYEAIIEQSRLKGDIAFLCTAYSVQTRFQALQAANFHLKYVLELISIVKEMGWETPLVDLYQKAGCYYSEKFMYSEWEKYSELAEELALKNNYDLMLGMIYYERATILFELDSYEHTSYHDSIPVYYKMAVEKYKKTEEWKGVFISYQTLSKYYLYTDQIDSCFHYLNASTAYIDRNECLQQYLYWDSFGWTYYKIGELNLSEIYLDSVVNHPSCHDIFNKSSAYKTLALVLEKKGEYEKALVAYKQHKIYNDSVIDLRDQSEALTIKHDYELTIKEQELAIKDLEIDRNRSQVKYERQKRSKETLIGVSITLSFVLLFIAIVLWMRYRNKSLLLKVAVLSHKKELNRVRLQQQKIELEKATKEKELIQLSEEQKTKELEQNQRELSAAAMINVAKNEFTMTIKDKIEGMINGAPVEPQVLRTIVREIDQGMNLDSDWDDFKIHFEKVHHNFFKRLSNTYQNLTPNELKLCAYLRVNLSSKEICQLLNITQDAINKRRQRLRKKIKINEDEDLVNFMVNF